MRDTLLTIHILAAGAWFGTNVVQLFVTPRVGDHGAKIAAIWHRTVAMFMRYLYMPASLVILLTGVLLLTAVDDSPYEFSDTFVSIGFAAIIVGAALGMAFFAPRSRDAASAYETGDTGTAKALENRIAAVELLDTAVIVLTVVAMVAKWGV